MESASYHMMGHRHAYDVWRTVDAFDYAVEHLSMYERMMHASKSGASSASRGLPAALRRRRDSSPSDEVVGGLNFDFEHVSGEIATDI